MNIKKEILIIALFLLVIPLTEPFTGSSAGYNLTGSFIYGGGEGNTTEYSGLILITGQAVGNDTGSNESYLGPLYVDYSLPTLTNLTVAPLNDAGFGRGILNLSCNGASDPESGIDEDSYEFQYTLIDDASSDWTNISNCNPTFSLCQWNVSNITDVNTSVRCRVKNNLGMYSLYETANFGGIDNFDPNVSLVLPQNNNITNNLTPAFSFNVTDNTDVDFSCELFINGESYGKNESVKINATATIIANHSLRHGLNTWNISCKGLTTGQTGISETRNITELCYPDDTYINNNTVLTGATCYVDDIAGDGIFIINNSNIELDCNGTNTIALNPRKYANATLINSNGFNDITIKNCTVQKFDYGIRISNANNGDIEDIKAYNNFENVIQLISVTDITLKNGNFSDNGQYAIYMQNSSGDWDIRAPSKVKNDDVFLNGDIDVQSILTLINSTVIANDINVHENGTIKVINSTDSIILNGNLTIDGNLTLDNSVLKANSSSEGAILINVTGGLELKQNSRIENGSTHRYNLTFNQNSYANITNSVIKGANIEVLEDYNLVQFNFTNVGLVIRDPINGIIDYYNILNFSGNNLQNYAYVNNNLASVDSTILPGLNNSAKITLKETQVDPLSKIYKNGQECIAPICSIISKPLQGTSGTIVFNVTEFTNYSLNSCVEMTGVVVLENVNMTEEGCPPINISDSVIINSTIYKDIISSSNITRSTISDSTSDNCIMIDTNISDSSCEDSTFINSKGDGWIVDPSTIINSTCYESPCYVSNSNLTNLDIWRSYFYDSVINDSLIKYSTIENATFWNFSVHDANILGDTLISGKIVYKDYSYYGPFNISDIYAGVMPVPVGTLEANPDVVKNGTNITFRYHGADVGFSVVLNVSELGGTTINLVDDGTNGDEVKDDAIYTATFTASRNINSEKILVATVNDGLGNTWTVNVTVYPFCLEPYDDMYINEDTLLCKGFYNINDTNNNGVIIINASDVVLDCNGAIISGNEDFRGMYTGIYVSKKTGVTIKNCTIKEFIRGIALYSSNNSIIIDNNISDKGIDSHTGIFIDYFSNNNTITKNVIISNSSDIAATYGIEIVEFSNNNAIINNIISNSSTAVYLERSLNNSIINNTVDGGIAAIEIENSHSNDIANNVILNSTGGIYFYLSNNNRVTNTVLNNLQNNIFSFNSMNNIILNSTFNKSKVYMRGTSNLTVQWYLTTYVNDTNGLAIGDATVIAEDKYGNEIFNVQTDDSGYTAPQLKKSITQIIVFMHSNITIKIKVR